MASYFMSKSGRIFTSLRRVEIQLASEITSPYSDECNKYFILYFLYNKNTLLYIKGALSQAVSVYSSQ